MTNYENKYLKYKDKYSKLSSINKKIVGGTVENIQMMNNFSVLSWNVTENEKNKNKMQYWSNDLLTKSSGDKFNSKDVYDDIFEMFLYYLDKPISTLINIKELKVKFKDNVLSYVDILNTYKYEKYTLSEAEEKIEFLTTTDWHLPDTRIRHYSQMSLFQFLDENKKFVDSQKFIQDKLLRSRSRTRTGIWHDNCWLNVSLQGHMDIGTGDGKHIFDREKSSTVKLSRQPGIIQDGFRDDLFRAITSDIPTQSYIDPGEANKKYDMIHMEIYDIIMSRIINEVGKTEEIQIIQDSYKYFMSYRIDKINAKILELNPYFCILPEGVNHKIPEGYERQISLNTKCDISILYKNSIKNKYEQILTIFDERVFYVSFKHEDQDIYIFSVHLYSQPDLSFTKNLGKYINKELQKLNDIYDDRKYMFILAGDFNFRYIKLDISV